MTTETTSEQQDEHWLVRPRTIRGIWIGGSVLLALTVVLQAVIKVKGYFGVDGWFAFGAVFGFLSCVAMVVVAKGLGGFLKRGEQYYDDKNSDNNNPGVGDSDD